MIDQPANMLIDLALVFVVFAGFLWVTRARR